MGKLVEPIYFEMKSLQYHHCITIAGFVQGLTTHDLNDDLCFMLVLVKTCRCYFMMASLFCFMKFSTTKKSTNMHVLCQGRHSIT